MLTHKLNKLRKFNRNLSYFLCDSKQIFLQLFFEAQCINKKEIRVIGLRRSGNHGIIIWLRRHYAEKIWHLNNVSPAKNPYRQLLEHYPDKEKLRQEAQGIFSRKKCLKYNFRNYILDSIINSQCEINHDLYLGKSEVRYDLLILRDPYNMFASICKGQNQSSKNNNYSTTYPHNQKTIGELWLDYAKEFLGETNYLPHKKVIVNYNQWLCNVNYRQNISKNLGLDFCDAGFNVVKNYGGGSSFDGINFNSQAIKMNLLNRWQKFKDNDSYKKMLNQDIIKYSQKIFGSIKGTESIFG